jgi:predicted ribosome quality control (RQC) complex YloA/Tae2 family protein
LIKSLLSTKDLESLAKWLNANLLGAQLQKVWTDGELLIFECYLMKSYWLCFDLNLQEPFVAIVSLKPQVRKQPKPVSLFLTAHGVNLRFLNFQIDQQRGRILQVQLGIRETNSEKICDLEAWLIPNNVNFFVKVKEQGEKDKKISWSKPRELPNLQTVRNADFPNEDLGKIESRDWLSFGNEWHFGRSKPREIIVAKEKVNPLEKEFRRSIQKKEKAIVEITAQLSGDDIDQYRKLGEALKYSSVVPEAFQDFYDSRLSLAENRERVFKKAKDLERKKEGTKTRLEILKQEIQGLNKKIEKIRTSTGLSQEVSLVAQQKKTLANKILQKAESKARKRQFKAGADNEFEAVMGKSAQDNLSILRHARAWDYWLHLRDYPGAHAIIFRNKGQVVPDSIFIEAAQWIVDETISKKQISAGVKYDVILAECRFVKPVKGATGLVTYQNTRTFTFASK